MKVATIWLQLVDETLVNPVTGRNSYQNDFTSKEELTWNREYAYNKSWGQTNVIHPLRSAGTWKPNACMSIMEASFLKRCRTIGTIRNTN